jgi:imidazolonepropionase-like amidohydrolase
LLGTDAFGAVIPGFSVPWELETFVRSGLIPYEALATGTRNVAVFLGTLDSTGTVAVGKRADLVLLTGNPLQDIRHAAHPAGVMLGGRWLSRAELDQLLVLLEGTLDG